MPPDPSCTSAIAAAPAQGSGCATLPSRQRELSRGQARALVAMVACAHIAALWLAFQVPEVRQVMRQVAPLMVDLIAPREPDRVTPPPPQPAPSMRPAARPLQRPSPILAAPTAESDAPATFATAPPLAEPAPLPPPSATAPAVATPAPPPQARRVLPATAVQYLVLPPVEVPRASRRAGESGMVWLKVVVGVQGLPLSVQVQRSSGYPRLDEQAVWAMRQARFKPQTENGSPIELEVTAPIEYPLE